MTRTPPSNRPRGDARPVSGRAAARDARRRSGGGAPIVAVVAVVALVAVAIAAFLGVRAFLKPHAPAAAATSAAPQVASTPPAKASASASKTAAAAAAASSAPAPAASDVVVANPAKDQAVPVLMYHHVMPNPNNFIAISPATFDAQMKYLSVNGYHPISIAQLQEFVYTGKRLPEKPVLITFDDGRTNQITYAVPILKKYGFTATFFVIKKWVVTSSPTVFHEADIKQLIAEGFDVQSHTTNHIQIHPAASKTTGQMETYAKFKSRYWDALFGMRSYLQDTFGIPSVTALAYPGGRFNPQAQQLAEEAGYKLAFTTDSGYITFKGQSPFALPRWNTGARGTTLATFSAVVGGAAKAARK